MGEWRGNWDAVKKDAAQAEAKWPELAMRSADEAIPLLPVIDTTEWQGAPPEREFAWGDWIPLRQSTMLTGAGGVGKSLLAQMLCSCIGMELPFLGQQTRQMNALYMTAEDDAEELWRRQAAICEALGVSPSALAGKLHLVSLAGMAETALADVNDEHKVRSTELWRKVLATVQANAIRFAVFDNATDMMAGDHNDVHQVAAFVNLLTGLAIRTNGVSLILHHPNKGGDDWLGSVAWHNKVRSRLIVKHCDDADHDRRTIENPKANYGPSRGKIEFRWHRGAFVRDDDLPPDYAGELAASVQASSDNMLFLACLAELTRQRRAVSEKRSPTFAPTVFNTMPESKRIGKARLEGAMDRLFRLGRIERAELWKGPDRKPIFGLRETAGNGAVNTMRETRETVSTAAENRAGDALDTHTIPKGISGAAFGAAAYQEDEGGDDFLPSWGSKFRDGL